MKTTEFRSNKHIAPTKIKIFVRFVFRIGASTVSTRSYIIESPDFRWNCFVFNSIEYRIDNVLIISNISLLRVKRVEVGAIFIIRVGGENINPVPRVMCPCNTFENLFRS